MQVKHTIFKYLFAAVCIFSDSVRGYSGEFMTWALSRNITTHEWWRYYDLWASIAFLCYCFTILYLLYISIENLADKILIAVWFSSWVLSALWDTYQEMMGRNDFIEKNEITILIATTLATIAFTIARYKKQPTDVTSEETGNKGKAQVG